MSCTGIPIAVAALDEREDNVLPLSPEARAALYERVALMAYGLTALPAGERR